MKASTAKVANSKIKPKFRSHSKPRSTTVCASSYRWSPDKADGRRKREGLYDNAEPGQTSTIPQGKQPAPTPTDESSEEEGQLTASEGWGEWGPIPATPEDPEDPHLGWGEESWSAFQTQRKTSSSYSRKQALDGSEGDDGGGDMRSQGSRPPSGSFPDEDDGFAPAYEPGLAEPDIAVLTAAELERVLPVIPFPQQANFFTGGATDTIQRWGASLAATVVLSKVVLLAAPALTWPIWWPWALAAKKNYALRKSSNNGGLWRTEVLDISTSGRPKPSFGTEGSTRSPKTSFTTMRQTKLLVGDQGGAQTELTVPYDARHDRIISGQPAELIVLSSAPTFESFKAVPEVYLPTSGVWVSEYPHLAKTEFLDVSLQIERERKAEEDGYIPRSQGGFDTTLY